MTNSTQADPTKVVRLVRHAQSAANAGLATTSPDSIPLTELGHSQAHTLAGSIKSEPDLIIASPFERAIHTALPTAKRFPDTPFEIWAVEEFTYLSPGRLAGTTQADRKPLADGYWQTGDMELIDGPGAGSFIELLQRAKVMLDRLAAAEANQILAFSHGQFIRAVAWFIKHGETGGKPELMRRFRKLDVEQPLANCAGYELMLRAGRWTFEYQLSEDGNVKFIDEFCTDQSVGPIP
ncbi:MULTISPECIES: histidine phosphatase family protein [unclassified Pseudomonas]|uniref:histidine phosphatase family protein n=1 Tax=unclassified Pseudomonas TaxID=196821 RepID=UPI00177FCC92|nr:MULTISPECIES: histidine phosphatase family protein [unclassified Pseudomonas]MBD8591991.1 histidine phosphatase family protein [Pseudomonas sp. CFBP 8758]MBD8733475.1 histidine phosphatase family protein [Pseudomonas sp. CFBP 13710]